MRVAKEGYKCIFHILYDDDRRTYGGAGRNNRQLC